MDFDFTSFITAETLRTFAGQVLVIVALTQLFKEIPTGKFAPDLRYVAVLIAVWIQAVTMFFDGIALKATLIVINGALVTLVAMKGAEMIKGRGNEPQSKPQGT